MRALDRIARQVEKIRSAALADPEALNLRAQAISGWSVAEQYDHALRSASAILGFLLEPGAPPGVGINWTGRAVLALGWIPRGVGRVPSGYEGRPLGAMEIAASAGQVRERLDRLAGSLSLLPAGLIWRHPVFGGLTAAQAIRFTAIHTAHHLAIVRDIRKNVARS